MINNQKLREDLKIQITDVFPSPGTILVVHPKHESIQFNDTYANWLGETLEQLLPPGVKGMVLSENVSSFNVISPDSDNEDYVQGWYDAIKAITSLNS